MSRAAVMTVVRCILVLLAGAFFANAIPHLVQGISGEPFPSPFGDPPGFGDSSPLVNVLWGSANLLIGYVLARLGRLAAINRLSMMLLFIGGVLMAIVLSQGFSR